MSANFITGNREIEAAQHCEKLTGIDVHIIDSVRTPAGEIQFSCPAPTQQPDQQSHSKEQRDKTISFRGLRVVLESNTYNYGPQPVPEQQDLGISTQGEGDKRRAFRSATTACYHGSVKVKQISSNADAASPERSNSIMRHTRTRRLPDQATALIVLPQALWVTYHRRGPVNVVFYA